MKTEDTDTEKYKTILLKRAFTLPVETVWKAWTDPESMKKWYGPKGFTCHYAEIDLREGGKYLNCMKSEDGKEYWGTGTFKEIVPQRKLVYTDSFSDNKGNIIPASDLQMPGEWPLELIITIELEDLGGRAYLTLKHEGIPPEAADDCVKGWEESFDKLEANLK